MRSWTLVDGQTFEARYLSVLGRNVLMENGKGTQKKIALEQFSADDREFFELENPPEFKMGIRKKSKLRQFSSRFGPRSIDGIPVVQLYTFGARVEKRSAGDYNHEVNIEIFVIGAQLRHNNKYILLDRQTSSFVPSKENKHSHEFWGPKTVRVEEYAINYYESRGKKYDTYLIILTDKRGKVIATKTPSKWLLENLENLKNLPVGSFMDTTCTRVYPGRPKAELY
ncbi:MAG: hypothetical protein KAU94_02295 [Verrucomicrobia bacterium]|nr:hypothetical protein [Verrucomicrobiota bacterium]